MAGFFNFKEKQELARQNWGAADWRDVAMFIGPGAHRFERVFTKQREKVVTKGHGFAMSWSWPVFLSLYVWFAYRKLWALAAVMFFLPIVLGFLLPSSSGGVGAFAGMAMLAKGLYLTDAVEKVTKINALHPPGPERDEHLASSGGVSITAAVLTGIVYALTLGLALFAAFAERG